MELQDYLRILRRRWVTIAVTFVLVVGAAAAVTSQMPPQYESTAQLFVSTSSSNSTSDAYQGSQFATQRVTSYADLVTGKELTQRVVDDLDLGMDATTLAERISAQAVPETVLLRISVTAADPADAQRLTQSVSSELTELVAQLETPPGQSVPLLKATIVDSASFPEQPVSPQPLRNLGLAVVLGLLLGVGLAVLRDLLDTSVKSQEDLAAAVDAPLLGGIAFDPDATKTPLVTSLDSHEPRVEAFRVLRTNLQFIDVDSDHKTIVVTSAVPDEGKSTTAANVALSLSQAGQRVLLLDADLRHQKIAPLLELEDMVGVTTVLVGQVGLDDAVQHHDSGLDVISSGAIPPNPAELLQSEAMSELLRTVRGRYDVVVIDTPPLLPVTDAALVAAQADGALLITRHGKTTRDQVAGATERLQAVGAPVLGTVLNMVPRKRGEGSYGYGGKYGYGYGYGPDSRGRAGKGRSRKQRSKRNAGGSGDAAAAETGGADDTGTAGGGSSTSAPARSTSA